MRYAVRSASYVCVIPSDKFTSATLAGTPKKIFDCTTKKLLIALADVDETVVLTPPRSRLPFPLASTNTVQPGRPGSLGAFDELLSKSLYTMPLSEPGSAKLPK